jgi:flagellar biosynthesis/type III secretory pathway chaperone
MELLLKELIVLLEGEIGLYCSLLDVLNEEKHALIEARLDDLTEAGGKKENLLLKLRIIEDQRQGLIRDLAEKLEVNYEGLSLMTIVDLVEEPFSSKLKVRRSDLISVTEKIAEANHSNEALINHSLELVKGSMTLLQNTMLMNPVYQRSGEVRMGSHGGRVLSGNV